MPSGSFPIAEYLWRIRITILDWTDCIYPYSTGHALVLKAVAISLWALGIGKIWVHVYLNREGDNGFWSILLLPGGRTGRSPNFNRHPFPV